MPINHLILDLAGRYYSSFEMLGYEGISVSGDSATPSVTETRDLFLPFLMASCKPETPPWHCGSWMPVTLDLVYFVHLTIVVLIKT